MSLEMLIHVYVLVISLQPSLTIIHYLYSFNYHFINQSVISNSCSQNDDGVDVDCCASLFWTA